jgi:hypothetical protein
MTDRLRSGNLRLGSRTNSRIGVVGVKEHNEKSLGPRPREEERG